jgi:hypothetical protein
VSTRRYEELPMAEVPAIGIGVPTLRQCVVHLCPGLLLSVLFTLQKLIYEAEAQGEFAVGVDTTANGSTDSNSFS